MQVSALKMNNLSHNWDECAFFESLDRAYRDRRAVSIRVDPWQVCP